MKLLVDTHCWLWMLSEPERLRPEAKDALVDPDNEVLLSVASAWEIVLKYSLGKLALPLRPEQYIPDRLAALGQRILPIELGHALRVAELPPHHKDPFDRVLIAQAQVQGLHLVTADHLIREYDVPIIWAAPA